MTEPELAVPAPGETPRRAGRSRVVVAALAATAAVLLPLTVLFAVLWNDARDDGEEVEDVRRVAGAFAERFLAVDTSDLDGWEARVLELSTGALKRDFEEGLETAVVQSILSLAEEAVVDVTVEEIYVGEVDERVGRVIVEAETTTRVRTEGQEEQTFPNRVFMALDLVRQEGGWLVDGLQHLNFGGGGGGTGRENGA